MSCSRLSELCSLLYSRQTPSLELSECCDILLRKVHARIQCNSAHQTYALYVQYMYGVRVVSRACSLHLRLLFPLQYDITECALLQLSALRCLYSDLCPPFHLTSEQSTDRESYSSIFSSEPTPLQNDQNGSSLDFREFSLRLMRAVSQRLPDLFQLLVRSVCNRDSTHDILSGLPTTG